MCSHTQHPTQLLSEKGYTHSVSPKMLAGPSDKDYHRIFQFLYHQIDPSFRFASTGGASGRKSLAGRRDAVKANDTMVEQIPMILKCLGCVLSFLLTPRRRLLSDSAQPLT